MKLKNFRDLSPELIVWEDIIEHPDSWPDAAAIQEFLQDKADAHIEQVGFVISEDDKWLLLASSYAEADETYSNVIKIPKAIIISRIGQRDNTWPKTLERGTEILNNWVVALEKQAATEYFFPKFKNLIHSDYLLYELKLRGIR